MRRQRLRFTAVLAGALIVLWIYPIPAAAITPGSMPTPYVNEADMASINEAFSVDTCAPWGFGHGGIDFFPTGSLKPFRAVADGVIEDITKLHNVPVDMWQVNLNLRIDSTYWAGYAFEPMSNEADADLQLTHIVVSEGQTVSQGDILGYLLTVGPGAHVHFSIYEVWDAICPDPYFTNMARNSILNVLGWTWPYARICYGLEQPIPAASILLDGDPLDWAGIAPAAGDWMNDDLPLGYSGDDLEALYIARSVDNLYLRMDLWDNVNPSFGNGPAPEEGRYSVQILSDSLTYPDLYLSVAYDVDNGWWALGHNGSNAPGSPPDLEERFDLVEASNGTIEIAVPLASIGSPTRIDHLRSEVVNCCIVPTFDTLDETHCVNNLVLTTPVESLQALIQYVNSLDLHKGTTRSLRSKLRSALRSLKRGKMRPAANKLGAFINHVEAQSGKKIPISAADRMIMEAEGIIEAINGG